MHAQKQIDTLRGSKISKGDLQATQKNFKELVLIKSHSKATRESNKAILFLRDCEQNQSDKIFQNTHKKRKKSQCKKKVSFFSTKPRSTTICCKTFILAHINVNEDEKLKKDEAIICFNSELVDHIFTKIIEVSHQIKFRKNSKIHMKTTKK